MGRAPLLAARGLRGLVATLVLCAPFAAIAAEAPPASAGFPVRAVKLVGVPGWPATQRHLEFCVAAGFNAVWIYSHDAGRWWPSEGDVASPRVDPDFLELTRWCRAHGVRVIVSLNPMADSGGRFLFSDPTAGARVGEFFRLLRREAGVSDFVLSFDDQPRELLDLRDLTEFGRNAAPAHLALARRVLRRTGHGSSVWLCGAAYSDWHLDDEAYAPYVSAWLPGLRRLPERIGIVWTGPDTISESITRADVERARERLGGRRILLYDNYPVNDDYRREALGLVLGPLRRRDPRLREAVEVYLACPMTEIGGSRLALLTIADYLRDPDRYDPDTSWQAAMARLAGPDARALDALHTQGLEWGGWVGTRNYQGEEFAPADVAAQIDDPGIMASWNYTLRRYEDRIAALRGLQDGDFRADVIEAMERRLAVARALPVVRGMRGWGEGARVSQEEAAGLLRAQREALEASPNALRALDGFLAAAGLLDGLVGAPRP